MSSRKLKYYNNFDKLSWATTGYHYDWTARAYKEDRKSIMPPVMEALGVIFAQLDMDMDMDMDHSKAATTRARTSTVLLLLLLLSIIVDLL